MSDEQKSEDTKEKSSPSLGGITLGTILSIAGGLASAALGAGWPGVIALMLLGLGAGFGLNLVVKRINAGIDARDGENAGADSGKTSVDLANQAAANRQDLADLKAQKPPTKPET